MKYTELDADMELDATSGAKVTGAELISDTDLGSGLR
jgi:hypothetical protein